MQFFRGFLGGLLVAAFLALGLLGSASPAVAQAQSPSQAIIVEGNHRVDADTVRSYFKGTDRASVDQGVKDLSASGLFNNVSARIVHGKVIVHVVESGIILNRVAFEGNSKIKSDQLAVEVQSKAHSGYNEAVAEGDIERIKEVYRRTGRNEARVTKRLVQLPNGKYDLVFTIDEGAKTGVKAINFVGNAHFSAYRLHGLMATTEMNFLSFIKTSDVYDPDRLASDEEAIRKYYMRHGFADFRITNTDVRYDEGQGGYIITISMDEGPQYRVSSVRVESHIPNVNGDALLKYVKLSPGDVYDATAVELSTEAVTRDVARQGYAFSQVRPHGDRDNAAHTIALTFTVDDGPKVYVERIEIRGNTRTRDYVIRREFDIGEGDPYNHVLIERAERRLNNLGFFKKVHITNRPGSSPDRVIVVVEVEDQPTGAFSISGGYSTVDGAIAEVSVTETNFLGRGQYVKLSASYGQYSQGWAASFTEPYLFDQRMSGGIDIYHKATFPNQYAFYEVWTTGATLRLGLPITDYLTFQPHYSLYESKISIPNTSSQPYDDCTNPIPGTTPFLGGTGSLALGPTNNCLTNGEASLALKQAANQGLTLTSLVGYSLIYNTLDNNKNPSSGFYANFKQDIAGLGGDSHFLRETLDTRYYYPLTDDFTGLLRFQAGNIFGFGGPTALQIVNNFNVGPSLVRGFAPGGIGPRDISDPNNIAGNSLGGTTYFGGTAEVQFPIWGVPKEIGLKGAVFVDAGTLFGFQSQTNFAGGGVCTPGNTAPLYTQGNCIALDDERTIRSSVGASLIWASPLGPIRIDYAYAITKGKYDQIQQFNFSGGTTF
ncbi:MAG TPA: outer membrane protein assembly factor BamA [Roseiarcus sp.]|nr:outer membrane protein assembly factor BamA [Roseiarcus sp.]